MRHPFVRILFPARLEPRVQQLLDQRGSVDYAIERRGVNHRVADDAFEFQVLPDAPVVLTMDEAAGLNVADVLRDLPGFEELAVEKDFWDDGMAEAEYRAQHQAIPVGDHLELRPWWLPAQPGWGGLTVLTEPGGLFGSGGEHSTTQACLTLGQRVLRPGMKVLDAGSGAGILAVASVMMGAAGADCVEIEEMALEETRLLARRNGLEEGAVRVIVGDVLRVPLDLAAYDLIYFNIGPRISRDFFAPAAASLRPETRIVLSGITVWSQQSVLELFRRMGREPLDSMCLDGEWVTFLL